MKQEKFPEQPQEPGQEVEKEMSDFTGESSMPVQEGAKLDLKEIETKERQEIKDVRRKLEEQKQPSLVEDILNEKGEKIGETRDGRKHFKDAESLRQWRESQVPKEKTLEEGASIDAFHPALVVYREEYNSTLKVRFLSKLRETILPNRGGMLRHAFRHMLWDVYRWTEDRERHGFAKYMRNKYGVHVMRRRGS